MLEGLVVHYLNRYLGKYVHGIDTSAVTLSLLSGDLELNNLTIKTKAFDVLNLPVKVVWGNVGRLRLKVRTCSLAHCPLLRPT